LIWLDGSKRRSIAHVLSITYATINQKKEEDMRKEICLLPQFTSNMRGETI
jgi:hypothetical protein